MPPVLPRQTRISFNGGRSAWWALVLWSKRRARTEVSTGIYFHAGEAKTRQIILSVKAGHVTVSQVRDLGHVVTREKAEIGVLISLEEPTGPMRKEAASAGFSTSPWGKHARLQLLTVEDLLTGKGIDRPPAQTSATFKRAPKARPKTGEQKSMFGNQADEDDPV